MDANDSSLMLLIGRIEGKVDTLVHMQGSTAARIEGIEQRINKVEVSTAENTASRQSSTSWLSNLIAVVAVLLSAGAIYIGML